jgi:hypothetical protein
MMTVQERSRELADSFINGNRKWVAQEVDETPGADAVELVLALRNELGDNDMAILLRLIALRQG